MNDRIPKTPRFPEAMFYDSSFTAVLAGRVLLALDQPISDVLSSATHPSLFGYEKLNTLKDGKQLGFSYSNLRLPGNKQARDHYYTIRHQPETLYFSKHVFLDMYDSVSQAHEGSVRCTFPKCAAQ